LTYTYTFIKHSGSWYHCIYPYVAHEYFYIGHPCYISYGVYPAQYTIVQGTFFGSQGADDTCRWFAVSKRLLKRSALIQNKYVWGIRYELYGNRNTTTSGRRDNKLLVTSKHRFKILSYIYSTYIYIGIIYTALI